MSSRWMAAVSGPSSRLLMDFQQMKSVSSITHGDGTAESAYSLPAAQKAVAFMSSGMVSNRGYTPSSHKQQSPSDS